MRRHLGGALVAGVAMVLASGCTQERTNETPGTDVTSAASEATEPTTDAVQDDTPDEPVWPVSTVALPGEPGQDVGYCERLNWAPVLGVLTPAGIAETGRSTGAWEEIETYHWPSGQPTPAGRILVGSCTLHLTSAGQPTSALSGILVHVWVFEASSDVKAFWDSWDGNEQFSDPIPTDGIAGAQLAATPNSDVFVDRGFTGLFAAGGNVMVEVGSTYTYGESAEYRTDTDPPDEALFAAYQAVAADAIMNATTAG